jgi:hypothetical protein
MVACVVGICPGPQPSPAQPDPAWPSLARPWPRAPSAPHHPMRAPPPPSLSQLFSRATTSSNLSPTLLPPLLHLLCPRCDPVSGCCDRPSPKVSPTSLSLSSPPLPSLFSAVVPPGRAPPGRALLAVVPPSRAPWPRPPGHRAPWPRALPHPWPPRPRPRA